MPTNVYFNAKVRSEQHLYEDLVIESLKMFGQDVYYLPRNVVSKDALLNEDTESQFDDAYMVEMYIEDTESFGGEGNLLSKFGLEIRDEATFIVAKRTWEKLVGYFDDLDQVAWRPREGDLLYLPLSGSFFEISFVEHEQPFYQLSNLPIYKMQARLFEYNDEDFNTGVDGIDNIELASAYTTEFELTNVNGNFIAGERITQAGSDYEITAKVSSWTKETRILQVVDIETNDGEYHEFVDSIAISGQLTGATADILTVSGATDAESFANDAFAQNATFETSGDSIIDFSESNPFGDPSED